MTTSLLCFTDVESTGLDPRIHQPYEVSWWREDQDRPSTAALPHTLEHADPVALQIGGYFDRGSYPFGDATRDRRVAADLARELRGVTLVGSNPSFDAAMLTRIIGCPVWNHRLIDVSQGAMWILGLDRPPGLRVASDMLRDRGFDIPEPDHTAEGDVRTTRAVYLALEAIRDRGMSATGDTHPTEKAEKLCGWPKPMLPEGSSVAHCSTCHRKLRFDLHLNQWVHILKGDR